MAILYRTDIKPSTSQIIEVYNSSGINRPTSNPGRITQMYTHANLVVSAWENDQLIGVARSLTDFCYCCYLSDLAVHKTYQNQGIGRELIELTRREIGPESMLLLIAAPSAVDYYPKLKMDKVAHGFIYPRKS